MPQFKSMRSGRPGALAEAAERLDRLARVVKGQQLAETGSGATVAISDSELASPEEAWAKRYMTQAIGPAGEPKKVYRERPQWATVGSQTTSDRTVVLEQQIRPGQPASARVSGGIGAAIGKPRRRGSWLGRLLSRRP